MLQAKIDFSMIDQISKVKERSAIKIQSHVITLHTTGTSATLLKSQDSLKHRHNILLWSAINQLLHTNHIVSSIKSIPQTTYLLVFRYSLWHSLHCNVNLFRSTSSLDRHLEKKMRVKPLWSCSLSKVSLVRL